MAAAFAWSRKSLCPGCSMGVAKNLAVVFEQKLNDFPHREKHAAIDTYNLRSCEFSFQFPFLVENPHHVEGKQGAIALQIIFDPVFRQSTRIAVRNVADFHWGRRPALVVGEDHCLASILASITAAGDETGFTAPPCNGSG